MTQGLPKLVFIAENKIYPGVAQFGSALEWGSRGRRFDSCHSDQTVQIRTFLLWEMGSDLLFCLIIRINPTYADKPASQDFTS